MIDILLAVYNGESFLRQQLDSLFAQTETNWRILAGDDCSSDSTPEIIAAYQQRYPGKIKYFRNQLNSGSPQQNFFRLVQRSSAPYLMTCDHDDVWLPDKIENTLAKMRELEQKAGANRPLLVHTDLKVVDGNLREIAPSMFAMQQLSKTARTLRELIVQNNVTGCTMMINRALADRVETLPPQALMHDWWFALVAAAFGQIGFVDRPTILYRQHGGNQVGAKSASSLSFLARRAAQKQQVKRAMDATYAQAGAFLRTFESALSPEQTQLLRAYANLPNHNKCGRWKTLLTGHFTKHGFARKIGQFLYI